jgi:hypothetical protein
MTNDITNPLEGTNGQLMVMAAHRYCLGRRTYIVSSCVEWLTAWWDKFEDTTRNNIIRDTIEALQDGNTGDGCDTKCWLTFSEWAWNNIDDKGRRWVKQAVAHRGKPWPMEEYECCGGCGKHASNCNDATGN